MHEVVTLQFGNRANYLATHFWNTQESYFTYLTPNDPSPEPSVVDHDIHFRPGIGADGSDTYTPRTLIYDFQPNFGSLRKLNALYDSLKEDEVVRGSWDGAQQTQMAPPIQPIQYQVNLESGLPTPQLRSRDVRYWSDFNRLYYHPRSIVPLSLQSLSSSLNAVESWATGVDLFKDVDKEVDILDRDVRPFVEESDSLSAFQVFSGVDDSWGGYTANYVEALKEEYGKKAIWIWAVEDERHTERAKQYQRLANSARSLRSIAQSATAYVRISSIPSRLPEYVRLETASDWSMSALMCAAIESVTLPTRLRQGEHIGGASISLLEDTLNANGNQNVWTLKARARGIDAPANLWSQGNSPSTNGNSMPQAMDPRMRPSMDAASPNLQDSPNAEPEPSEFDIDFSPSIPTAQATFPSLTTSQSRNEERIFAQIESHRYLSKTQLPRMNASLSHEINLQRHYASEPIVSIYNTALAFPLLDSYPDNLFHVPVRNRQVLIDAALLTSSSTKYEILGLRDIVAGRMGRGLGLIETDEVEAMYDDLTKMGEAYNWGVEGSDKEDEDD